MPASDSTGQGGKTIRSGQGEPRNRAASTDDTVPLAQIADSDNGHPTDAAEIDSCQPTIELHEPLSSEHTEPASADDTLPATQSQPAAHLLLPTRAPERYVRNAEIAHGGVGRIIAAHDQELDRDVAIKELRSSNPEQQRRFEREVHILSRLQHPSIISVLEAGRWPSGKLFFTMKHVHGQALDKAIAGKKTLADRLSLLPHVVDSAEAMAYAHSQRVIHRDLKPANVLVGAFGETVVIDWGLAKDLRRAEIEENSLLAPQGRTSDELTIIGQVMGTPAYMPPEQASGGVVDERADVYALGALRHQRGLQRRRAPREGDRRTAHTARGARAGGAPRPTRHSAQGHGA